MNSDTSQQPAKPWHVALLILLPVAANLPALTGLVDCDPEMIYSGLASHFLPGLIPGNACFLDPTVGYITQSLGYLSAQDWLHGIVPWWNPYSGVGMPLAAEMQNESFFLPFVLLLHFKSGWLYQKVIFQILAGIFTFAFLRARHLHDLAALTGALLFALNGSFFLHAGAASGPIFCLPLMMLGVESAVQATVTGRNHGWSLLAAGLAISIYAGFPEIAFFDGLLVAVWAVFRGLQIPRSGRTSYLRKLAAAGAIGVAVTAPVTVPFLQYLSLADLASHGREFPGATLPVAAAPITIFPYIYGALGLAVSPELRAVTGDLWVKFDGWIGCVPYLFALAALSRGHQDRPARFVMAGWLATWAARDYNWFDIKTLFNLVPMIAHADAIRFTGVAREFAAFTLTAYGINDLFKCRPATLRQASLIAALFCLCIAASIIPALPILRIWFNDRPELLPYAAAYLSAGCAVCAVGVYAMVTGRLRHFVPAALIIGAVGMFLLPQLAAPRGGTLDVQAIAKIKSITGMSRIYSTGPLGPNFPARYAVASINHSQLPVPKLWTDFITDRLFPGGNAIDFQGGETDQVYSLISNIADYEAIGVKYILTPPGQSLADWKPPPRQITQRSGFVTLVSQSQVSGVVAPLPDDAVITRVTVFIGTIFGDSTGPLQLRLCAQTKCANAEIDTAAIPDVTRDAFVLDQPLKISKNMPLSFTFAHPRGAWVAVFLTGSTNGIAALTTTDQPGTLNFQKSHAAPAINVSFARTIPAIPVDPASLPLTYQDDQVSIHELPDPAPYASASDAACAVQIFSRQHFTTNCPHPGVLTRRELFFPGWQARINHQETLITQTAGIFQAIALPAGPADIRFTYEPLHTHLACLIAILALFAWMFLIARHRATFMASP